MDRAKITVRDGLEKDFPAVARIQQQCAEAAQWPLGDYSGCRLLIAELDGRIAGFCTWRQAAPDEAELLNLGVAPDARRSGLATALLNELERRAAGDIFLEVAEHNHAAAQLYTHRGWVPVGLRKRYYPGDINAIVMKKGSC